MPAGRRVGRRGFEKSQAMLKKVLRGSLPILLYACIFGGLLGILVNPRIGAIDIYPAETAGSALAYWLLSGLLCGFLLLFYRPSPGVLLFTWWFFVTVMLAFKYYNQYAYLSYRGFYSSP